MKGGGHLYYYYTLTLLLPALSPFSAPEYLQHGNRTFWAVTLRPPTYYSTITCVAQSKEAIMQIQKVCKEHFNVERRIHAS